MSNLYAQKVFSEHPIAMWSFDDKVNYISLIDETDRAVEDWTLGNATAAPYTGLDKELIKFPDSVTTQIQPVNELLLEIEAESAAIANFANVYPDVPISAAMFVYVNASSIDYIDFGSTDGVSFDVTRNYFPESDYNIWVKVSHYDMQYDAIYFKIVFKTGYTGADYEYLINGLTVGQYSEPTSSDSLGITPVNPAGTEDVIVNGELPDSAAVGWYEELSFGINQKSAYHIIRDDQLLSYNTAMPIAYGSNYLTRLRPIASPNEGAHPSLMFDGCGMFTEQGRYSNYTVEFWLRIGGVTSETRKIFGPTVVDNEDGLFITSSTMLLSIGNKFASCDVGKFGEPMLVHIVYTPRYISLLINGDVLATIELNPTDTTLLAETKKWLGFYSYADLDPIEIDCLSVFGYEVPNVVAKRRFIWGQGVGDIGIINAQYSGNGVFSDFALTGLTNSFSFPDSMFWESGSIFNLDINNNKLTPAATVFPELVLANYTQDEWLVHMNSDNTKSAALETVNKDVHFNFRPTVGYDESVNYAFFSSPGTYCDGTDGLTIAFKNTTTNSSAADKTAVKDFLDSYTATTIFLDGDTWATDIDSIRPIVRINDGSSSTRFLISYLVVVNTVEEIRTLFIDDTDVYLLDRYTPATDTKFLIIQFSGSGVFDYLEDFMADTSLLSFVVGSDQVITGDIDFQSIGFFSNYMFETKMNVVPAVAAVLEDDGTLPFILCGSYDDAVDAEAIAHKDLSFVDYTYLPKQEFGHFYEDVGIRGSWEDYIPLASIAGVVEDFEGNNVMAVDSIQYNIGHPAPKNISNVVPPGTWTYDDMATYYAGLSLGFLYLGFFTGYQTYNDLMNRSTDWDVSEMVAVTDTTNHFVKSFVTLQDSRDGMGTRATIPGTASLTQGNAVYFQAFEDYENILFEVADGAILVPPRNKNVNNLVLFLALDFDIPGVLTYPVSVKSLELAGFSKNRNDFTSIKSKSGKEITPIVYNGIYYDNSAHNPFRVDKKGLPYLYLGNESGFIPSGPKQTGWKKGLQVAVPEGENSDYYLDDVQFWIRRPKLFPVTEYTFAEFDYSNSGVYFTVQSFQDDETRGIIRVYSRSGEPFYDGTFFQNGNAVANPVIEIQQWNAISFAFDGAGLNMQATGTITVYPGFAYNNISYFETKPSLGALQVNYRSWTDVLAEVWSLWESTTTWDTLLVSSVSVVKTKELSQVVYKSYIGTQAISVNAPQSLVLRQDTVDFYTSEAWSSVTIEPV